MILKLLLQEYIYVVGYDQVLVTINRENHTIARDHDLCHVLRFKL